MPVAHGQRRAKGRRLERKVLSALVSEGHAARSVSHSDQSVNYRFRRRRGRHGADLVVPFLGLERTIQCRHWERGFEAAYLALKRDDIACVQMNRHEPLIIMTLSVYLTHLHAMLQVPSMVQQVEQVPDQPHDQDHRD